jgi:hypothetical protein
MIETENSGQFSQRQQVPSNPKYSTEQVTHA